MLNECAQPQICVVVKKRLRRAGRNTVEQIMNSCAQGGFSRFIAAHDHMKIALGSGQRYALLGKFSVGYEVEPINSH
jgi:hypothetical protein